MSAPAEGPCTVPIMTTKKAHRAPITAGRTFGHGESKMLNRTTMTIECFDTGAPHRLYSARKVDYDMVAIPAFCGHVYAAVNEANGKVLNLSTTGRPFLFLFEGGRVAPIETAGEYNAIVSTEKCTTCLAGDEAHREVFLTLVDFSQCVRPADFVAEAERAAELTRMTLGA